MSRIWSWLWRVGMAGVTHAAGAALGSLVATLLMFQPQHVPTAIDPARQWALALIGGMVIALGLAAMATGMSGRLWQRWTILAAFAFVVNGISIALETRIFTTLGGELALVSGALFSSSLCAFAVARLFPAHDSVALSSRYRQFVSRWKTGALVARLTLALLAFPLFYLMFGAAVAPVVNPWYGRLDFLQIPPFETIIGTQLVRSALFLLVSIPVVIAWSKTRPRLILALGTGHFAAVGFSGLIQTPIFPPVMALAHTIEILGDSVAYAWTVAFLLFPVDSGLEGRPAPRRALVHFARALRIVAALLCFAAIGSWPHLYYMTIRWVVLVACLLSAWIAHRAARPLWSLTFVAIAIVFNPLLPMPFPQQIWMVADAGAGIVLLASAQAQLQVTDPAENSG